jgi:septation ring formation regulator EzrA
MNVWKKIIIGIIIIVIIFAAGFGAAVLVYSGIAKADQDTIDAVTDRNTELTDENIILTESNRRKGKLVSDLEESERIKLAEIERLEERDQYIKNIVNEIQFAFGTAADRLQAAIDGISKLIIAFENY